MSKSLSALALLAAAGVALAQGTPGVTPSDTPSVTPSQTPSVTPSQTPSVTPSQTPSVTPSQTPSIAVGGLSRCENMLGDEKEKCQKEERAASGSSAPLAPYSTRTPSIPPSTPSGSVR